MFEKIPFLFKTKVEKRIVDNSREYHISNYPESTKTLCGQEMGSHWDITGHLVLDLG